MNRLMLFTLVLLSSWALAEQPLSDIDELRWHNRVIIVLATELDHGLDATLAQHSYEIIDRDIVWFIFHEDTTQTNYSGPLAGNFRSNTLKRFLNLKRGVLLLGKDGYVKSVSPNLNLQNLFKTIDAMPMRRYELQNRV